jgi:hypothetical protein
MMTTDRPTGLFTRRSLLLVLVAVLTMAGGYGLLVGGNASLAAVLLVVGYVILFPLALLG